MSGHDGFSNWNIWFFPICRLSDIIFNLYLAEKQPFTLGFYTLNNAADDVGTGNGFSLDYTQVVLKYIEIDLSSFFF